MSEHISFADFSKLDIRIGKIVSVEPVPETDKLLRLMVEVGEDEPRQVISGIREYFTDPQTLVGRCCPFLCNLEPRTIKGLESQAMILAADHDTTFALLESSADLPSGTAVH